MNIFTTLSFKCDSFVQMWQFQTYQSGTVCICTREPQEGGDEYKLISKTCFDVQGAVIHSHTFAVEDMVKVKTGDVIAVMYISKHAPVVIPYADSRDSQSMGSYEQSDLSNVSYHPHTNNLTIRVLWKRLPAIRAYTVQ